LAELAAAAGLDKEETLRVLAGSEFTDAVRADEQEAAQLGVRGVPYFVLNRKYAVSGAQSSELFLQALQKAWEEDRPLTVLNSDGGSSADDAACVDGACAVPAPSEAKR
jgi:predicted DsbA family dithiol-disulfide isomerase